MRRILGILAVLVTAVLLMQPAATFAADQEAASAVRFGGDLRLRQEYYDDIPASSGGVVGGGENNYFRIRPRFWGEVDPINNVTLKLRVVEEFRIWENPSGSRNYMYPDEWVVDLLYVDIKKLMNDKLDLRIGRQELMYGNGILVLEGTPKDGSRTLYFDAVKASVKASDKTTVDFVGIYNQPENDLAINSENRDVTGQAGGYNDETDAGGIIYVKNNAMEKLPLELYYIFKNESEWETTKTTGTGAEAVTTVVEVDEADIHTAGVRLMPKINDSLSGNLELAGQIGEQGDKDLEAYAIDAALKCAIPCPYGTKPTVEAGVYVLSGDDPDTADNEGWNPLWARYPQRSELYVFSYPVGRWSNLMQPRICLSVEPTKWMKAKASVSYLEAMEDDGPGDCKERGMLYTLRTDFVLGEKLFMAKDKLTAHVLAEVLEPGDYYIVDETAVFYRWELAYAF